MASSENGRSNQTSYVIGCGGFVADEEFGAEKLREAQTIQLQR
jgi:hypothetical protein